MEQPNLAEDGQLQVHAVGQQEGGPALVGRVDRGLVGAVRVAVHERHAEPVLARRRVLLDLAVLGVVRAAARDRLAQLLDAVQLDGEGHERRLPEILGLGQRGPSVDDDAPDPGDEIGAGLLALVDLLHLLCRAEGRLAHVDLPALHALVQLLLVAAHFGAGVCCCNAVFHLKLEFVEWANRRVGFTLQRSGCPLKTRATVSTTLSRARNETARTARIIGRLSTVQKARRTA